MSRWLDARPLHDRLVVLFVAVSAVALLTAGGGVIALELWHEHAIAVEDAAVLAGVLAENTSAAVAFSDAEAAQATLAAVHVRGEVRCACVYLPDGTLFAGVSRRGALPCPDRLGARTAHGFVTGQAPVRRDGPLLATAYVERDEADLFRKLGLLAAGGSGMLLLAGASRTCSPIA